MRETTDALPLRHGFLVYVPRSGSTLLARLIQDASDEVVVIPETRIPEIVAAKSDPRSGKRLDRLLAAIKAERQTANLEFASNDWSRVRQMVGDTYSVLDAVGLAFAERMGRTPSTVIYKHSATVTVAEYFLSRWRDTFVLHIVRDGRASACSMVRARDPYRGNRSLSGGDWIFMGQRWARYMNRIANLRVQFPDRVLEVRYEQLCQDPVGAISGTLAELGIDLADGGCQSRAASNVGQVFGANERTLHTLVYGPVTRERTCSWQSEIRRENQQLFERYAGHQLTRYGYANGVSSNVATRRWWRALAVLRHAWARTGSLYYRIAAAVADPRRVVWNVQKRRLRGSRSRSFRGGADEIGEARK